MICRCSRFHAAIGNARCRSRSVRSTELPFDRPQRHARRWMWVSTGNAGTPNACAITTLAVLWPTPGRVSRAARSAGTTPPNSVQSRCARLTRALAFCGARPHERMQSCTWATGSAAIAAGVRAKANRPGVTWLTRASVHCADSSTAHSSVNGSSCCSGIGGAGKCASRMLWMRCARAARFTTLL